ncbi:MAG TPA: MFS transporter [Anaerolineales bacterium]|nr:MFS transporter [Anaerolineales bacterium]
MSTQAMTAVASMDDQGYKRRVWAWTMYDWANSAFATTILAAVLPVYYSQVAGATLPSASVATAYWSAGLSISLLIVAIISPILGTVSDIMRGKKLFLAIFAGIGILGTALLVLVGTGDWMLASVLAIVGRIGFNGANVFYDALLPHVAREDDRDRVSARGYAMGYLGGGVLLGLNIVMIQMLPGTWGARLSFLSVAIWWTVFSIPLFRHIPEPPAAANLRRQGENAFRASFRQLSRTLKDIQRYRELFKYLVAFLIYVDGIGTIIGVAAIYGAELGFGSVELILALLLVQFVGIPYSLIFGRLPSKTEARRPLFLAFILFSLVALPVVGIAGARLLPAGLTGSPPAPYAGTATAVGQGTYLAQDAPLNYQGAWQSMAVSARELGGGNEAVYRLSSEAGAEVSIGFFGQSVEVTYSAGPDYGIWTAELDGQTVLDEETGEALRVDAYHPTQRFGESVSIAAQAPGEHTLRLINTGEKHPASQGAQMGFAGLQVLPPARQSNLGAIIGLIVGIELLGLMLALLLGRRLFSGLVQRLDTKRSILLALSVYAVIAIWGFFLNSVIEFWFLAWMVAVVQGGSQALSRSLFAAMSPASKSGEFFGLFGIMEKFAGIVGPLFFLYAATQFGNSRPAILSIIVFFVVGGLLLTRVNVDEGKRVAEAEDRKSLASA